MSNITTDDILNIISDIGTTSIRRGTNDISASPGFTTDTKSWTCEVTIQGYLNVGFMSTTLSHTAPTPFLSADGLLEKIQEYLSSDKAKYERKAYVDDYNFNLDAHNRASKAERNHRYYLRRHPGKFIEEAKIGL